MPSYSNRDSLPFGSCVAYDHAVVIVPVAFGVQVMVGAVGQVSTRGIELRTSSGSRRICLRE